MMPSTMPSFPDGLRETHLHILPLSKLLAQDAALEDQLFEICKTQGFFYLDLTDTPRGRSLLETADRLEQLSVEAFKLSDAVKESISLKETQSLFGWKASGIIAKDDPYRRTDVGQFWNISKDDVYQNPGCRNLPYPSPIKEAFADGYLKQFMADAHSTGILVLDALARKLKIPSDVIANRHRINGISGDHIRLTYGPGDPNASDELGRTEANTRITTTGHTDFGTTTILFNWLGGLQIENQNTGGWEWVRPVPGHAIVNLGDAMKEFSGHRLASGKHRVVAAPGNQAKLERYSVVYFVRPKDDTYMEDLAKSDTKNGHANGGEKRWKAGEWILERARFVGNNIPRKDG